jgi:hypothetical protein
VQKRSTAPRRVHPAFTLALALVALPILVLFGLGFMNDEGVPWRIVIVLAYVASAGESALQAGVDAHACLLSPEWSGRVSKPTPKSASPIKATLSMVGEDAGNPRSVRSVPRIFQR